VFHALTLAKNLRPLPGQQNEIDHTTKMTEPFQLE